MTKEEYWYWFCTIPGFGAAKLQTILAWCGSPKEAFCLSPELLAKFPKVRAKDVTAWQKSISEIDLICRQYHQLEKQNIQFITKEQAGYPGRLLQMYDAPMGLFYRGSLPLDDVPSVAIIGARGCTSYGRETARVLGKQLAQAGIQIISGMALGIDGAGQRGAIEGGGQTFGVLGSGVDICYPKENFELYCQIPDHGGLISEYPPGQKGLSQLFPVRNRIIAGLSDCIIVVEARKKSGTLITVDQALDQGKDIFAVPGRIEDPLSVGCNELIRNGAGILTGLEEILNFFHMDVPEEGHGNKKSIKPLANEEKIIYSCLSFQEKHIEEILGETGLTVSQAMIALLQLELKNYIYQPQKNYYARCKDG